MTAPTPDATATAAFSRADFMSLTKARLSALVVVTTFAGFVLAAGSSTFTDPALLWRLLHCILGTTMAAFGSAVFNQLMEIEPDALMKRTATRPLPGERVPPAAAFILGFLLCALGIMHLGVKVNTEAAALALLTLLTYLFIYTPMKQRSVLNTLVGAVSGALPPVIGWVAPFVGKGMVPQSSGGTILPSVLRAEILFAPQALFLFTLLFLWQLPHFLSINWMYREEYMRGGFIMWCNEDETGHATARRCMGWSFLMLPLAVWPPLAGFTSWWFAVPALLLGGWLLVLSYRFYQSPSRASARKLFLNTLLYLPLMLLPLLLLRRGG